MAAVQVRFIGDKWKPTDRVAASLQKGTAFGDQLDTILAALKCDRPTFDAYNMHVVVEEEVDGKKSKKSGRVLAITESPNDLHGVYWVWLKKPAPGAAAAAATAAAGGAAAPPPPPPRPKSKVAAPKPAADPSSAAGDVPPPPPPPRPASSPAAADGARLSSPPQSGAVPPRPPPRPASSRAVSPSRTSDAPPPPPPPRPKSAAHPEGTGAPAASSAVPPPPPPRPQPGGGSAASSPAGADSALSGMQFTSAAKQLQEREQQKQQPHHNDNSEPAAGGITLQVPSVAAAGNASAAPSRSNSPVTSGHPSPASSAAVHGRPAAAALGQRPAAARPTASRQPSPTRTPVAAPSPVKSHPPVLATADADAPASSSRAVDDRLQAIQQSLLEDERRRVEELERKLVDSIGRESARARLEMEGTWEAQRVASMQQQASLAEERAELMATLAGREQKLFEAQARLISEYQSKAVATADANPAIEQLRQANAELKDTLERRRRELEAERSSTSADVAQVVKMQAQLMATLSDLQRVNQSHTTQHSSTSVGGNGGHGIDMPSFASVAATAPPGDGDAAAVAVASYDALTKFMARLGLSKFVPALMAHDVDMATLRRMSDADLLEVGVATVGARRKIRVELERLEANGGFADGDAASSFHHHNTRGAPRSRDDRIVAATGGPVTNLTAVQLRRHHRILRHFFSCVQEPVLAQRAETILRQFVNQLEALYAGLAHKYDIIVSNYRPSLAAFLRRERLDYLLPALDIICFAFDGQEAEFAEVVLLEQLGQSSQPLTWLVFNSATGEEAASAAGVVSPTRRPGRGRVSPGFASQRTSGQATPQHLETPRTRNLAVPQHHHHHRDQQHGSDDGDNDDDGGRANGVYYYNALVHLSQWEPPRAAAKYELAAVVDVTYASLPDEGSSRILEANPTVEQMVAVQSINHRYVAATTALLMRHDPTRLSQLDALRKQYCVSRDVEYARGGGEGGPLNAKKLYLDLRQWYSRLRQHSADHDNREDA